MMTVRDVATGAERVILETPKRAEPSNSAAKVGNIAAGNSAEVASQHEAEGYTWYRLTSGEWVRADVISIDESCAGNLG